MNFEIVPFEESLLAEAEQLEPRCFTAPWSKDNLESGFGFPWTYALAAKADGVLVAYLFAVTVLDEGELLRLAAAPEYRRQHIAQALLSRMFADHPQIVRWRLDVRCHNEGAIRLYEKNGFRILVRNPDYYSQPKEDGFLMIREAAAEREE